MANKGLNLNELKVWLNTQPREASMAIAVRAALRVVPLLGRGLEEDPLEWPTTITLPSLRALASVGTAVVAPIRVADLQIKVAVDALEGNSEAVFSAASAVSASVKEAVDAVATAVETAHEYTTARANAGSVAATHAATESAAAFAASDSSSAAYAIATVDDATKTDWDRLMDGMQPADLLLQPLWPENEVPDWATAAWGAMKHDLLALNQDWQVWTEWYEDVLTGKPFIEDLEIDCRLAIPQAIWEQGPAVLNAEIKDRTNSYWWEYWKREREDDGGAEDEDADEPFIFFSYARQDETKVRPPYEALQREGLPVWWDQEIEAGERWRTEIAQRLEAAAIVLTCWTQTSARRDAVIEEAATAQSAGKLVQVKLDGAKLPYGFAETQYLSLDGWQDDPDDPRFKRLIQTLKDRLFPPSRDEKLARMAATGPASAVLEDGKIGIASTPPDGEPEDENAVDLRQLFEVIEDQCRHFLADWQDLSPNVPEPVKRRIEAALALAQAGNENWYLWEGHARTILQRLERDQDADWRGLDEVAATIRQYILRTEPYLKPLPVEEPEKPEDLIEPEIVFDHPPEPDIAKLQDEVAQLEEDAYFQSIFTEDAQDFVRDAGADLAAGTQEGEYPGEKAEEAKYSYWRGGLRKLAGFAATATTAIAASLAANALSSPAAAQTILARLDQILALLLRFF